MRKTLITAIGALSLAVAITGGSALAGSPDKEPVHSLSFKRAISEAEKVARAECEKTAGCIAYAWGIPSCSRQGAHKWNCPIDIITGTPGDQATQQDCKRNIQLLIKRLAGNKLFFKFTSTPVCVPNTAFPGF